MSLKTPLGQYELDVPVLTIEADMNDVRVYAEERIHARIDAFMDMFASRAAAPSLVR